MKKLLGIVVLSLLWFGNSYADMQGKIVFANKDDKVGLAVGITDNLIEKYDAVKFAKLGSEIIGGKGGGGRKDFAQAGGTDSGKIDHAISKLKEII